MCGHIRAGIDTERHTSARSRGVASEAWTKHARSSGDSSGSRRSRARRRPREELLERGAQLLAEGEAWLAAERAGGPNGDGDGQGAAGARRPTGGGRARELPSDADRAEGGDAGDGRARSPYNRGPMPRYGPPDPFVTPRFSGPRTFMRLPHVRDLDGVDVAIVGIPTDGAVVYRTGARFGPEGIRSVSVTLAQLQPAARGGRRRQALARRLRRRAHGAGLDRGLARALDGGAGGDRARRRDDRLPWRRPHGAAGRAPRPRAVHGRSRSSSSTRTTTSGTSTSGRSSSTGASSAVPSRRD